MLQKKISNRTRRIKPELPGGFRDYPVETAIAKQRIIDVARETFERFGFEPIETSSVQRTEVLTGGEEDSGKIIFNVNSSTRSENKNPSSAEETSDISLRFDLTVPLARFIAENPEIPKPFKRYEIGRVWRGERQQAGRYREFTQADVDIVGTSSLDADAEVVAVIYTTLKNFGISDFVIKINDRKILNSLPSFAGFPQEELWEALRIIDKKNKIGQNGVHKELESIFGKEATRKISEFVERKSEEREEGEDLRQIAENLDALGVDRKNWKIDPSLVRGLSYYTGMVFETILTDVPEMGSMFGGGRYDDLVMRFTGQKIPAVGVSLGVDRLLAALEKLEKLQMQKTPLQVLILNISEDMRPEYLALAQELRNANINTSLYLGEERAFQAQLAYAVKKEIPYVIIYGEDEKKKGVVAVKNLSTREQKEVKREEIIDFFDRQLGKK